MTGSLRDCGHKHATDLEHKVCKIARTLNAENDDATVGIVVFARDDAPPAVTLIANAVGAANVALAICHAVAESKRPKGCLNWIEAYDQMMEARAVLLASPRAC